MRRSPVYQHIKTDPPGETVYQLRIERDISQRDLADKCSPRLNHTTIRRLENNLGFKKNTIDRVAKAFDIYPRLLFYPPEIAKRLAGRPIKYQQKILAKLEMRFAHIFR
jgi:transcriptional regulator with XRE-family HTH domain